MKNAPVNRLQSRLGRVGLALVLSVGLGLTAACDTAEERAEGHYQTGMALLAEGDVERALVEFRNVFKLNGKHQGARLAYAKAQRERGLSKEAYSQYLRLVEQYPENLEGLRALSELAADQGNWPEAERHVSKAIQLAPEDKLIQSIHNSVKYFNAVRDKDEDRQNAAVIKAQALVNEDQSLASSRDILIDSLLRKQDWYAALDAIDQGLLAEPDRMALYRLRLGILQQVGDTDGIETQLRELMDKFPEDRNDFKQTLVQFIVAQGKIDQAEAFLREESARQDATIDDQLLLVGFLEQMRGKEAALEEVNRHLAEGALDEPKFRSMRAKLRFQMGEPEAGISEMEALIKDAERNEQTRQFEVDLARMLFRQNNSVGARSLVEKVLAEDSSQPDAVKLKANWLIDDDETGDAIVMLRAALNQSPEDADLMTLMARAYEREGNKDLREEMLALAVQASNQSAPESIRYARALAGDNKLVAAESVLIDALRIDPRNTDLLGLLGDIYAEMEDWGRTDDVIRNLQQIDDPQADVRATALMAKKLATQDRGEELNTLLEGLTADPVMGSNVEIALVRSRLGSDGPEAANAYLDELLQASPDDPALRFMKAGFLAGFNKLDEAEAMFRGLLEEDPQRANAWLALYQMKVQTGQLDEASKVLDESLAALPENGTLLWAKAGEHERAGDFDSAIAIYNTMYDRNSDSLIVANNLASLLASHREDADSLQRAYTVARRLRDSDVPAFQDTYGWIMFRRGSHETALDYLQAAAIGLPGDITVQYHLAVNLAALARNNEALPQFQKVAEMIDPENPPSFAQEVIDEIKRLGGEVPAKE